MASVRGTRARRRLGPIRSPALFLFLGSPALATHLVSPVHLVLLLVLGGIDRHHTATAAARTRRGHLNTVALAAAVVRDQSAFWRHGRRRRRWATVAGDASGADGQRQRQWRQGRARGRRRKFGGDAARTAIGRRIVLVVCGRESSLVAAAYRGFECHWWRRRHL